MESGINALIIDDHPLFRDALEVALTHAQTKFDYIVHAASINEALSTLDDQSFKLILLDLNLSGSTNLDGLSKIKAQYADIPIIIISATENTNLYNQANILGATGYIPKSSSLHVMAEAIDRVMQGNSAFPDIAFQDTEHAAAEKLNSLTAAQKRVMSGLSDGLLNKQIAYEMGISEATVKAHMTAIFRKLGANNRTQALLIYRDATTLSES